MSRLRLSALGLAASVLCVLSYGVVAVFGEPQDRFPPSAPSAEVPVRFVHGAQGAVKSGVAIAAIDLGPKVGPDRSLQRLSSGVAFLVDLAHPPATLRLDPCAPERRWTVWVPGSGRWMGIAKRDPVLELPVPGKATDPKQMVYESLQGRGKPLLSEVDARAVAEVRFRLPPGWIGGSENDLVKRLLYGTVDGGKTYVPIGPWDPKSTYVSPGRETLSLQVGPWRAANLDLFRQDPDDPAFVEYRHLVGYRLKEDPLEAEFIWIGQRVKRYEAVERVLLVPELGFAKDIRIVDMR